VAAVAQRVPARYRALVLVAAFGGLRWGELAGLRRKRVDLERGTVTVAEQLLEVNGAFSVGPPKSAAGRRAVSLPALVVEALAEHLARYTAKSPEAFCFSAARARTYDAATSTPSLAAGHPGGRGRGPPRPRPAPHRRHPGHDRRRLAT
jgi:integrase